MTVSGNQTGQSIDRSELIHAARTTVAAVGSLLVARLFRLPEAYWAAITSMIVMQSTLGAAWRVSKQRLAGTALGAAVGALLVTYVASNTLAFAAGVLFCGGICAVLHIDRNAFRYAGITLAVVALADRNQSGWVVALNRFIEISLGIAFGLIVAAVWPESPASETTNA